MTVVITDASVDAVGRFRRKHPSGHARGQRVVPNLIAVSHLSTACKADDKEAG